MAKDPAFLMYYQDWLVGTAFMSFQAKGAYMDILCHMADKGPLKTNDIEKICKGNFKEIWPEISEKFKQKNHFWFNEKLNEVMQKRKKFSESRRNNRLGKKKTKQLVNNTSLTSDKLVENENENENEDQITIETKTNKKLSKKIIPPTLIEIESYIKTKNHNVNPQVFFDYFEAGNWHDSQGKPVKSWKQKLITWNSKAKSNQNKALTFAEQDELNRKNLKKSIQKEIDYGRDRRLEQEKQLKYGKDRAIQS